MSDGDLEDLVASFIERREAGEKISAEEFARAHPERAEELLAALGRVTEAEELMRQPGTPLEQLGPYRLLGPIGSGGMGRVYRAVHEDRPDEELALKVLSHRALGDSRARARFERECRALAQLDHPGVVRVLDHRVVDDIPCLAMEWVRGPSLAELLDGARRRRALDEDTTPSEHLDLAKGRGAHAGVALLVSRLARAVAAVHGSGVLHRDIKPANVILHEDGRPVLVDFGLARGEETVSLTATGDLLGTPRYMAPEQARGETVDGRADVHALGVLLYELLTLEVPHPGRDAITVLASVLREPIPAVTRVDPSIPADLRRIVTRASAFRPDARYPTGGDLAADLEAFVADRPVEARPFGPLERVRDLWLLRRPWLVGVVLTLAVLVSLPFLREEPPDLAQLVERATMAYAAGDMAGTATAAQRILDHDPDHAEGKFLARMAAGEPPMSGLSPAVDELIRGQVHVRGKVWRDAIEAFEKAQRLAPDSPLPKVLLEQADRAMADEVLEYEADLDAEGESAKLLYDLGRIRNERGHHSSAALALRRALELDPDYEGAHSALAVAQYYLGRREDVLITLDEGGPRSAIRYARTLLLREQDEVAEYARSILLPLLQDDPHEVHAMEVIGFSYDYGHDFDQARSWYERIIAEAPDSTTYLWHLAYLLAGSNSRNCPECAAWFREHPEGRDEERAEELSLRILELDRGRTGYTGYTGEALRRLGRTRKAQELIERLLAEDEGALTPAQKNNLTRALEDLRR